MNRIEEVSRHGTVQRALASFEARQSEIEQEILRVQQIPAPTFDEEKRAAYVAKRFRQIGLHDVGVDSLHNAYGRLPGQKREVSRPTVLSAHSDTVFPANTDLTVHRNGHLIYGPGIGDNSTGVAGLIVLAETMQRFDLQPAGDLWFVCNACEEGLGDLRGMRAVVERFGSGVRYIVIEGGLHGQISHQSIGVRRLRIEVRAPGGHSWGSFGQPSAVHELARLIVAIDQLHVSEHPKTTYNVGKIEGGTSVNTIARTACFLLDLRSESAKELERLVGKVDDVVATARRRLQRRHPEVQIIVTSVGNRPTGHISRDNPLVRWAEAALKYVNAPQITYMAGSTDANIPLSQGIPAVVVGLTVSGNAHREDEYIEPSYLPSGMQQLLLLTLAAAGF